MNRLKLKYKNKVRSFFSANESRFNESIFFHTKKTAIRRQSPLLQKVYITYLAAWYFAATTFQSTTLKNAEI
jgi:hypothetical protein